MTSRKWRLDLQNKSRVHHVVIDLTQLLLRGIGSERERPFANSTKDFVKFCLAN
jgi:hypothetical protein